VIEAVLPHQVAPGAAVAVPVLLVLLVLPSALAQGAIPGTFGQGVSHVVKQISEPARQQTAGGSGDVFALIALGWWLAAPDKFTAAARTASGTGLKAAGTGARVHWNGGRDGRQMGRTDRRDRWHAKGGWWRKLLGLEHGAVVTGKAVKGAGKLATAAVRPVPAAVRDGWRAGQDRHGARTAGRPVPVETGQDSPQDSGTALDPPWWRKPDPAPVPDETGQDSPQDSGTDPSRTHP
jgi:hypothetical protein